MRDGLLREGLQYRSAVDGERVVGFFARCGPDIRNFNWLARVGLDEALRQRGEFADGRRNHVAAKTEPLLDGLREVHAVKAVEAEIFQQHRRLLLVGGERALEFFLKDFAHDGQRLGLDLVEWDVAAQLRLGIIEPARAEEKMVGHEFRLGR